MRLQSAHSHLATLLVGLKATESQGADMQSMLDFYASTEPNAQSTVDIFKGEWLSVLPGGLNSGWADLFNVDR